MHVANESFAAVGLNTKCRFGATRFAIKNLRRRIDSFFYMVNSRRNVQIEIVKYEMSTILSYLFDYLLDHFSRSHVKLMRLNDIEMFPLKFIV